MRTIRNLKENGLLFLQLVLPILKPLAIGRDILLYFVGLYLINPLSLGNPIKDHQYFADTFVSIFASDWSSIFF